VGAATIGVFFVDLSPVVKVGGKLYLSIRCDMAIDLDRVLEEGTESDALQPGVLKLDPETCDFPSSVAKICSFDCKPGLTTLKLKQFFTRTSFDPYSFTSEKTGCRFWIVEVSKAWFKEGLIQTSPQSFTQFASDLSQLGRV